MISFSIEVKRKSKSSIFEEEKRCWMKRFYLQRKHMKDNFEKEQRNLISCTVRSKDIVMTMTEDEEIICAAVLHDTIEDCKDVSGENNLYTVW